MKKSPHVVVIGAGTLGMSTAINLAEQGASVTVIEAQAIASGSSGRSVGVVGTQFTDPFEILLRQHTMRQFRRWEAEGLLHFNHIGYLRLARTKAQMAQFEASVTMQAEAGFRSSLYQADQLQQLVPHISADGLAGGIFGPDDGFIDPHQLCMMLADKVRALGGEVRQFCKLLGVTRKPSSYLLETEKGIVEADIVVNAAGAWAPRIAALFGQVLHVRPERHEAVTILLDQPLDYTMPMVMDLVNGEGSGLNFRHENRMNWSPKSTRSTAWSRRIPISTTTSARRIPRSISPNCCWNACRTCRARASAVAGPASIPSPPTIAPSLDRST